MAATVAALTTIQIGTEGSRPKYSARPRARTPIGFCASLRPWLKAMYAAEAR
jgi:hypothetical protein